MYLIDKYPPEKCDKLVATLIASGMSQATIAKRIGVNQSTVSRILAGRDCFAVSYVRLLRLVDELEKGGF